MTLPWAFTRGRNVHSHDVTAAAAAKGRLGRHVVLTGGIDGVVMLHEVGRFGRDGYRAREVTRAPDAPKVAVAADGGWVAVVGGGGVDVWKCGKADLEVGVWGPGRGGEGA